MGKGNTVELHSHENSLRFLGYVRHGTAVYNFNFTKITFYIPRENLFSNSFSMKFQIDLSDRLREAN